MQSCGPSPRTPFPEAYYGLSLGMSIKDFEKRYPDLQKLPQRLGHIDPSRDPGRVGVTRTYIKEYLLRNEQDDAGYLQSSRRQKDNQDSLYET